MRHAGLVIVGTVIVLATCGFAPLPLIPQSLPPPVPLLESSLEPSAGEPLATALTADTRRQVETLLIHA